ncbi:hypothetical protein GJAV_G00196060 [Gymnothorax javanicus]|nr:hypothetical protein GJAV_G00196060 [Gymnothorax javanicus]
MSVEDLVAMTPLVTHEDGTYSNTTAEAARQLFALHIKNQPSVRSVFFPDAQTDPKEGKINSSFDIDKFAVAYVCQAIAKTTDHGFSEAIDLGAVNSYLDSVYARQDWVTLGYQLYTLTYPDVVRHGGTTFRHYMENNPTDWGRKLHDVITTDPWMNNHMSLLVHGEWPHHNEAVNVLLFMISQLDNKLVDETFRKLKKGIPDIYNNFEHQNYLGLPLDIDDILLNVRTAQAKKKEEYPPFIPTKPPPNYYLVTYGEDVCAFIQIKAREHGFYSGKSPRNIEVLPIEPCIIM